MYSNNILNFQEPTTILNAYTKKSGNILNVPRVYIYIYIEREREGRVREREMNIQIDFKSYENVNNKIIKRLITIYDQINGISITINMQCNSNNNNNKNHDRSE